MRARQLIHTSVTICGLCSVLLAQAISQQPDPGSLTASVPTTSIEQLRQQAESGDATAQFSLGQAYDTGSGVTRNPDKAATWYRKAAAQDNAKAQNSLGVMYWMGNGVDRDKEKAVEWYRKAARQLEPKAMFNLGAAYYNGEGIASDPLLAVAWFLLSAEAGDPSGLDAAKRSRDENRPWLINDACVKIGQMYEQGADLPKNSQQAVTWYRKAADAGSGEATIALAVMYLKGNDVAQARPWCEAAAKAKLVGGYHCLAYLYQRGAGVAQDLSTAFKYYKAAAEMAHPPSMYALGVMYENGEGTKLDRIKAFSWLIMAARRGHEDSLAEARKLRSSMTEKEWKTAQQKLPLGFSVEIVNRILDGSFGRTR